jgi:hypothetical protein
LLSGLAGLGLDIVIPTAELLAIHRIGLILAAGI